MSKLFKSKFLLGVMVAAFVLVGVAGVSATPAKADCTLTVTLRVGSSGAEVMCLQGKVGTVADGKFGPMTRAAVVKWQADHGLVADGIVGPMTRAALNAQGAVSGNFPPGCTSAAGYSPTTGAKCDSAPSSGLPAGCSSTAGYSVTTGKRCDSNVGDTDDDNDDDDNDNGPLSGGAADVEVSQTSTDVESEAAEGEDDVAVLGFEVEADGGDVEVTSVRVMFVKSAANADSERLENYVDEVTVWLGDEEVGSASAEDFSRESGTPDEYTETIQLDGAIIREGDEEKMYIAVSTVGTIDSDEQDAEFVVTLESLRFEDSTGAVLTENPGSIDETFGFDDASSNDDIELKSSSTNPEDETVQVEEDESSEEVLALVAKLENDEDSSEVTILDIPVEVRLDNYGTDAVTAEDVIESVMVSIDGEEYEADLSGAGTLNVDGTTPVTVTYNLDLDDGDVAIGSDETVDVKVYVIFNEQEDNYDEGTMVTVSIDPADIDAETENDEVTVDGSTRTGGDMTLSLGAAEVTVTSKSSEGTSTDADDAFEQGTFSFTFKVEAEGEDTVLNEADVLYTVLGPAGAHVVTEELEFVSGDADESPAGTWTVAEGDTATFVLDVTVDPAANGTYRVRLDSVDGNDLPDDVIAGPETLVAA